MQFQTGSDGRSGVWHTILPPAETWAMVQEAAANRRQSETYLLVVLQPRWSWLPTSLLTASGVLKAGLNWFESQIRSSDMLGRLSTRHLMLIALCRVSEPDQIERILARHQMRLQSTPALAGWRHLLRISGARQIQGESCQAWILRAMNRGI